MTSDEVKALRQKILELREQHLNPTQIARELGCSRVTVYTTLDQGLVDRRNQNKGRPPTFTDEARQLILAARQKNQRVGPLQLHHLIRRKPEKYGFSSDQTIPSPTTIANYIHTAGWANKPVGPRDTRLYPDSPPLEPGTVTIDTWGPWHIRADKVYLATIQDRYSRATAAIPAMGMKYRDAHSETPGFTPMTWAAAVAVAKQYLSPSLHTMYADNGVGLIPAFNVLPVSARYILSIGARLIFIPPAQPWRNGKLERFHSTLEREYWDNERPATVEDGLDGLTDYLNYYNFDRPHSRLQFKSPAQFDSVEKLPARFWNHIQVPTTITKQAGTIVAIRMIYNDGLVDLWGNNLQLSPLLAGQYVRVQFQVTGEPSAGTVIYQASKGVDNIIATFTHNLDVSNKLPMIEEVELTDYVIERKPNQNLDENQLAQQQSRILKRRSRLAKKRD